MFKRKWKEVHYICTKKVNNKKPKFNILKYQGKYAMLCRTEEELDIFSKYLHKSGVITKSGDKIYTDFGPTYYFACYKERTCVFFNEGLYGDLDDTRSYKMKVLMFNQFDWEGMS